MPGTALQTARRQLADVGLSPRRWLLVDTAAQILDLVVDGATVRRWRVSTAAAGVDARQDSGGTPPGVHVIGRRIGLGGDPSAIYVSREPTGELWDGGADPRDLILGRILTLEGCEPGRNQGPGVDSRARYIYLHGTNHEDRLGTACSHGCVRLSRADVVDVADRVEPGDPVVIV
jgi:UDP-N-acetylmuramate--alanine ligase